MRSVTTSAAILVGAILCASDSHDPATAQPVAGSPVLAELVSEVRGIRPGTPFWLGVRLVTSDGWHVNWVNPGDAGLAPEIEWALPEGFAAGEIQWPLPRRHDISGLAIFGYEGDVILMCRVTPPDELPTGKDIAVRAGVTWLACREACVPGEADLSLTLPVIPAADRDDFDTRWKEAFARSREEIPTPVREWRFKATAAGDRLVIEATPPKNTTTGLAGVAFFPFRQGIIENSAPQTLTRDGSVYRLELRRDRMNPEAPARLGGVLVSENGWGDRRHKAVEIDVPVD